MSAFCSGELSAFSLSDAERRKLFTVCTAWYPGSRVPEPGEDWRQSCSRAFDAPEDQITFLTDAFGIADGNAIPAGSDAAILCEMAMLDSDQDDVLDYQITVNGRFVENDIDVDQDGIPNVRDTNPVDSTVGQPLSCGNAVLPDHLAFACDTGSEKACELQNQLFSDFDMVVINRDMLLDQSNLEKNLQTIYDSANLVFRQGFDKHPGRRTEGCKGLWTMQTVAFEQCVEGRTEPWNPDDLKCENEEDQTTEASAMAHNGLFTVYPAGANLPRVIQLGTYVHELGHLWQFAYDIRHQVDTLDLITDNLWRVPEFEKVLEELDWEFAHHDEAGIQRLRDYYTTVLPREYEMTTHPGGSYLFQGYSLVDHRQAVDLEGLLLSDENKKLGNFGSYSLKDPWEWHADLFIAYLFRALEERIAAVSSIEVAGEFTTWFRLHVLDTYNNNFYHPNLKNSLYEHMKKNVLPVPDNALDELICRYLVYDEYVYLPLKFDSSLPIGLDESPIRKPPDYLGTEIKAKWSEICAHYL